MVIHLASSNTNNAQHCVQNSALVAKTLQKYIYLSKYLNAYILRYLYKAVLILESTAKLLPIVCQNLINP